MQSKISVRHALTVISVALSASGCAGVGANFATPAPKHPVEVDVVPLSASAISETTVPRPTSNQADVNPRAETDYVYRIGAGDVLSVFVEGVTPPSIGQGREQDATESQYLVSASGQIFLPLHGPLLVAGSTIEDAYQSIRAALSSYINTPQVNVRVVEFRSQRVTIAGAVADPGFVPITDRPMTVTELVVLAQASVDADLRKVVLKRQGYQRIIDVAALMDSPRFGGDWVLQHRDVVVVPPNKNQVYVVGEAPNRVEKIDPYDNSLAEVLLGGLRQSAANQSTENASYLQAGAAKPSHVFVIRQDAVDHARQDGALRATVYHLDASAPEAFILASQFQLADRDVVYVATRNITRYNRFLQQILPSLQTLLVPALLVDQFQD